MRRLLILVVLLSCVVGGITEARQGDESPTIYLYLYVNYGDTTMEDEFVLVPDWLEAYLFDIQSKLILAGERPVIVTDDPQILGDPLSTMVADADDYDDIFAEPPFRALYIRAQRWRVYDTVSISPYTPFPYEPLPIGLFGWVALVSIPQEGYPEYLIDMTMGMALYTVEACDDAIPYFQHIRETADFSEDDLFTFSAPRFYEANCRYTLGQGDAAAKLFEEIMAHENQPVEDNPSVEVRWHSDTSAINLAAIYLEDGMTDRALALLDQYQHLDPEGIRVAEREFERYFARADLYFALGQPDQMLAEINELLDYVLAQGTFQAVSIGWLYTERGYRYEQIDDIPAALADYERAIEFAPNYPVAYYRRGLLETGAARQQDLEQFLELAEDFELLHHPSLAPLIEDAESRLE